MRFDVLLEVCKHIGKRSVVLLVSCFAILLVALHQNSVLFRVVYLLLAALTAVLADRLSLQVL